MQFVSVEESPDLLWDAAAREVVTARGDVAARDVDLEGLPSVAGKWEAVARIRALSATASLELRVSPDDRAHRSGSRIDVEVGGHSHPWLTLVGLAGNGQVHFLYPLPADPPGVAAGIPFRLPLEATPPFGADPLVAVAAAEPLHALNAELALLDGSLAVREAAEAIALAVASAIGWQSGIQGLYTTP